jgi:hypothetical protein
MKKNRISIPKKYLDLSMISDELLLSEKTKKWISTKWTDYFSLLDPERTIPVVREVASKTFDQLCSVMGGQIAVDIETALAQSFETEIKLGQPKLLLEGKTLEEVKSFSLFYIGLSKRAVNHVYVGHETVAKLLDANPADLLKRRNFGKKSLVEIVELLHGLGFASHHNLLYQGSRQEWLEKNMGKRKIGVKRIRKPSDKYNQKELDLLFDYMAEYKLLGKLPESEKPFVYVIMRECFSEIIL